MKVSITKAADMIGVTRSTFYRHVDDKGISVERDADGNPKVDVAELIRVYGDRVRPDGHSRKKDSDETGDTIQFIQDYTGGRGVDIAVELEILRERIENLQKERDQSKEERDRERALLTEQINMMRERLIESEQQQRRLTLLLTSDKETADKQEDKKNQRMDVLEETLQKLTKQNKTIYHELQEQKRQREERKPWWQRAFKSA